MYFNGQILLISLKQIFSRNNLGCYGLSVLENIFTCNKLVSFMQSILALASSMSTRCTFLRATMRPSSRARARYTTLNWPWPMRRSMASAPAEGNRDDCGRVISAASSASDIASPMMPEGLKNKTSFIWLQSPASAGSLSETMSCGMRRAWRFAVVKMQHQGKNSTLYIRWL